MGGEPVDYILGMKIFEHANNLSSKETREGWRPEKVGLLHSFVIFKFSEISEIREKFTPLNELKDNV